MNRIAFIILLLAVQARAAHVQFDIANFVATAWSNKVVTITPAAVQVSGSSIIVRHAYTTNVPASGTFILSNVVAGNYTLTIGSTPASSATLTIPSTNGLVSASACVTDGTTAPGYSSFVRRTEPWAAAPGTNMTATTNGSVVTLSSTASGSGGIATELDAGLIGQPDAGWPLAIPTYDGKMPVTHPNVVALATNWNGYRWWMAYTPYPAADRENPSILCSSNGINWQLPPNFTNYVATARAASWYTADTELVMLTNGSLALFWIDNATVGGVATNNIMRSVSTTGTNWSTPIVVSPMSGSGSDYNQLSPTITVETDGTLRMWTYSMSSNSVEAFASADMGTNWTWLSDCTNWVGTKFGLWHFDVQRVGSNYYMGFCDTRNGGNQGIGFASSTNGYMWDWTTNAIGTFSNSFGNGYYKPSLVCRSEVPLRWDIYAGTWHNSGTDASPGWRMVLLRDIEFNVFSVVKDVWKMNVRGPAYISSGTITNTLTISNKLAFQTVQVARDVDDLKITAYQTAREVLRVKGGATGGTLEIGSYAGTVSKGDLVLDPGKKLYGDISGTSNAFPTGTINASNVTIVAGAYNQVPLLVEGTDTDIGLIVNSNGYVGVGTLNPTAPFHVAGNALFGSYAAVSWGNSFQGSAAGLSNFPTFLNAVVAPSVYTAVPLTVNANTGVPGLIVNSNGWVGVNTLNPLADLHVAGSAIVSNGAANSDTVMALANAAQVWEWQTAGGSYDRFRLVDRTGTHYPFSVAPECADNTMVLTNGTVLIGTTSHALGPKVVVLPTTSGNSVLIKRIGDGTGNVNWGFGVDVNTGGDQLVVGAAGGTYAGSLAWVGASNCFLYYPIRMRFGTGTAADPVMELTAGKVVSIPGGLHSTNSIGTTVIGVNAGTTSENTNGLCIGSQSGFQARTSLEAVFAGYYSGRQSTNSTHSVSMGAYSVWKATNIYRTLSLGYYAGSSASNAYGSVFLGAYAGTNTVRPNTLLIDTQGQGTNALVYGEFDTPMVRINGSLTASNYFTMTNAIVSTNALDLLKADSLHIAAGTISISNLVGTSTTEARTCELLIDANGADRILRVPASWRTSDGLKTWTVTNGTVRRIIVKAYANLYTNLIENTSFY